jgi:hypothetical protein
MYAYTMFRNNAACDLYAETLTSSVFGISEIEFSGRMVFFDIDGINVDLIRLKSTLWTRMLHGDCLTAIHTANESLNRIQTFLGMPNVHVKVSITHLFLV